MYLARVLHNGGYRIVIRRSYFDADSGVYRYRQLFDLRDNPALFVHQLNDRVVFFDETLERSIEKEYGRDPTILLEELLWDYLPLDLRKYIGDFGRRKRIKLSPLSVAEKKEVDHHVHLLDRRRMYFIRYGAADQSRIYRLNDKLYRPLLFKCRDEKEWYFKDMERSLSPGEMKKYIFVIFNLHEGFSESYSRFMPEALDSEVMDKLFLERVCQLNDDDSFWQDDIQNSWLRWHLQSYVIRFFDLAFSPRSFESDFINSFRANHRRFAWPQKSNNISDEETSEIFGMEIAKLKNLNRTELIRIFRKKAKEHHPDRGGEPEKFVQLLQAYEDLKKRTSKTVK